MQQSAGIYFVTFTSMHIEHIDDMMRKIEIKDDENKMCFSQLCDLRHATLLIIKLLNFF